MLQNSPVLPSPAINTTIIKNPQFAVGIMVSNLDISDQTFHDATARTRVSHLGRQWRTFIQLKRYIRFDDYIMLVLYQGSIFHIATGSHPVRETWGGGHKSKIVCTGVKFKRWLNFVKNHTNRFLLLLRFRKSIVWPIYDVPFCSY